MSQTQGVLFSAALSFASVLIAAVALVQATRAQRDNYNLARKIAEQSGRLQAVKESWYFKPRPPAEPGWAWGPDELSYKVINGPSEVTVTEAELQLTYISEEPANYDGEQFTFKVQSNYFELLRITGPKLKFRLAPHDVAEWRIPVFLWRSQDLLSKREGQSAAIQLRFSVSASGTTTTSEPYTSGTIDPLRKYRKRGTWGAGLDRILFASMVHNLRRQDMPINLTDRQREYFLSLYIPDGLLDWLMNVAEQTFGGSPQDNDEPSTPSPI